MRVHIYQSFYGKRLISISSSEEDAWENIKNSFWYDEDPDGDFSVNVISRDLNVVNGTIENWGDQESPNFHVHWLCPKCSKVHHTDIEQSNSGSAIWFCEIGTDEDIFFVKW